MSVTDTKDGKLFRKRNEINDENLKHDKVASGKRAAVLGAACRDFLAQTTAHGAAKLTTNSKLRRGVYLLAVLTCTSFLVYTLTQNIIAYYEYESFFSVQVRQEQSVEMPSVTICSYTTMTASAITHAFSDIDLAAFWISFIDGDFSRENFTQIFSMSQREAWETLGPTIDATFVRCRLAAYSVDNCTQFISRYLTDRGYCFTLPTRDVIIDMTLASREGGASFLLDANPDDYLMTEDFDVGFEVFLHNRDEYPFSDGDLIYVGTGQSVNIAFRKETHTKLSSPYSERDCVSGEVEGYDPERAQGFNYSRRSCLCLCTSEVALHRCNCSIENEEDDATECTLAQFELCTRNSEFWEEWLVCNYGCPERCEHVRYETRISTSSFPNNFGVIKARVDGYPVQTEEEMRRRMLELNIYPQTLEHTIVTQQPRYHPFDIFSNIGGLMGLCLGVRHKVSPYKRDMNH